MQRVKRKGESGKKVHKAKNANLTFLVTPVIVHSRATDRPTLISGFSLAPPHPTHPHPSTPPARAAAPAGRTGTRDQTDRAKRQRHTPPDLTLAPHRTTSSSSLVFFFSSLLFPLLSVALFAAYKSQFPNPYSLPFLSSSFSISTLPPPPPPSPRHTPRDQQRPPPTPRGQVKRRARRPPLPADLDREGLLGRPGRSCMGAWAVGD